MNDGNTINAKLDWIDSMCAIIEELENVKSAYLQHDEDGMMASVNKVLMKMRGSVQ